MFSCFSRCHGTVRSFWNKTESGSLSLDAPKPAAFQVVELGRNVEEHFSWRWGCSCGRCEKFWPIHMGSTGKAYKTLAIRWCLLLPDSVLGLSHGHIIFPSRMLYPTCHGLASIADNEWRATGSLREWTLWIKIYWLPTLRKSFFSPEVFLGQKTEVRKVSFPLVFRFFRQTLFGNLAPSSTLPTRVNTSENSNLCISFPKPHVKWLTNHHMFSKKHEIEVWAIKDHNTSCTSWWEENRSNPATKLNITSLASTLAKRLRNKQA